MEEKDIIAPEMPNKTIERVTLGKPEAERVSAWLKQVEDSSKGFASLTKSDLVNFLVRSHKAELSTREIQQIRNQNYDPIRHLNWITPRLKEALAKGDAEEIAALQQEIRGIEVSVIATARSINGEIKAPPPDSSSRRKRRQKRDKEKDLNPIDEPHIVDGADSAQ